MTTNESLNQLLGFPLDDWDVRVKPFYRVDENGCWRWSLAKNDSGYGRVCFSHTNIMRVHIVSYLYHSKQPIPNGLCVLHKCDVRDCLNPEHLFLGTKTDNSKDMLTKDRGRGGQSLNSADLTEIRRLIALGITHKEIAARMHTSIATVSRIRNDGCKYYTRRSSTDSSHVG